MKFNKKKVKSNSINAAIKKLIDSEVAALYKNIDSFIKSTELHTKEFLKNIEDGLSLTDIYEKRQNEKMARNSN